MDLHQNQLKGFTPEQAETHFLRLASQLDTYAVDPHPVKVSLSPSLSFLIPFHEILTPQRFFPLSLLSFLGSFAASSPLFVHALKNTNYTHSQTWLVRICARH